MSGIFQLITGLPGAGKSLGIVERMEKLKESHPHRPVYAHGISGLKDSVAVVIDADQVKRWRELPPNSIVVVDEAQKIFPARRGEPPQFERDLSEHRHEGVDFIIATQHPSLLSGYVRKLIDRHTHHVRKFGGSKVDRYEWPDCCDSPLSKTERKRCLRSTWRFPKKYFDLYQSAEVHTVEKRVPWKVYAFWVLVVGGLVATGAAMWLLRPSHVTSVASGARSAPVPGTRVDAAASSSGDPKDAPKYATPEAYALAFTPRIANEPWSAPAYDADSIRSRPDIYCMEFQPPDGNAGQWCQCYTEQATRYHVPLKECEFAAREGVYNPHRPALDDQATQDRRRSPETPSGSAASSAGVAGVSPAGDAPRVGANYDPGAFKPSQASAAGSY